MSADGKGNPPFGRQDSGVYSSEPTPMTPQQPLGPVHPVVGAASVSPLSPIDEAEHHQYPDLDADCLKRSLRQLSEKNESDAVSDGQVCKQRCHLLQRSNSAGEFPISQPRVRPTNLIPNQNNITPKYSRGSGQTETLTPSKRIAWLAAQSDESLQNHPELMQAEVDKIVQRLVPERTLDPIMEQPPHLHPAHLPATTEEPLERCGYPHQMVLHPLNRAMLCPGRDGHYYNRRDFIRQDEELLGEGGFGKVLACQDLTLQTMFAMKSNNQCTEEKVKSMKRECDMLHDIGDHEHITQFLGAVMDDEIAACNLPQTVLKMMMELADNGNLSEMLVDPDSGEDLGLPLDQSLFYLQQVLHAVHYLHQRRVLHLDLKCKNILVFNDGRRVKLADFGTAVKLDDLEREGVNSLVGCTPNFSAPEVVRSEDRISFSADVWSVMCVLVEMVTGKQPWCYRGEVSQQCLIYTVGNYCDEKVSVLVPFQELQLDEDVRELFCSVFRRNSRERPTALDLLRHHRICDAHEYEKFFDEQQCEDYEEQIIDQAATDSVTKSSTSTPISDTAVLEHGHKNSVDSGHGSMGTGGRSSRSGSSNFSSCAASPASVDEKTIQRSASSPGPHRRLSAPCMIMQQPKQGVCLKKVCSHTGLTSNLKTISLHSHPSASFSSSSPLIHSNSAPSALGRRHTLSMTLPLCQDDVETDGGTKQLKRTSSENYVSNGPDVDSPEAKAAIIGILRSPPSSSPPHNKSSKCSILADLQVVSQGTQTSLLNSPTDKPEQQVGEKQEREERTEPTTWLGPGANGGQSILHSLI